MYWYVDSYGISELELVFFLKNSKGNKCEVFKKTFGMKYRKSSIRSQPCIILNQIFLRLVLEVFQKVSI